MSRQISRKTKSEVAKATSKYDMETSEQYLFRIKKGNRTMQDEMRDIFGEDY